MLFLSGNNKYLEIKHLPGIKGMLLVEPIKFEALFGSGDLKFIGMATKLAISLPFPSHSKEIHQCSQVNSFI